MKHIIITDPDPETAMELAKKINEVLPDYRIIHDSATPNELVLEAFLRVDRKMIIPTTCNIKPRLA